VKMISLAFAFFLGLGLQSFTANSNGQTAPDEKKSEFITLDEDPNDDELRRLLKRRYNIALGCVRESDVRGQLSDRRDLTTMSRGLDANEVLLEAGLEVFDDPKVQERLLVEHIDRLKAFGDVVAITENEGAQCNAAIRKLTAEIRLLKFRRQMQAAPGK
jgi:hypothetical protein